MTGSDPELVAMTTALNALLPLEPESRERVLNWLAARFGFAKAASDPAPSRESRGTAEPAPGLDGQPPCDAITDSPRARTWLKQIGLPDAALHEVFHKDGGSLELIAPDLPGDSARSKTQNAYILTGVIAMLRTGEPKFSDAEARTLCNQYNAYDANNHSSAVKALSGKLAGNKETGFTVTRPGLATAANLLKQMCGL